MNNTLSQRRIGAYGGTFDPIHNGHIEVVRAVARNFRLDQSLIIPAHKPPHKDSRAISNAYHRYAMAVLASLDEPGVLVSTVEIESPDKPYSFQTVEQLNALYGAGTNLFFIMGADSFEEINSWREPSRLLAGANVVVVTRPGYELQSSHLPADFISSIIDTRGRPADQAGARGVASPGPVARHVYLTDYVNNDVSSTEIRQRVRDGEAVEGLVSPRVAGYIEKYELYRR